MSESLSIGLDRFEEYQSDAVGANLIMREIPIRPPLPVTQAPNGYPDRDEALRLLAIVRKALPELAATWLELYKETPLLDRPGGRDPEGDWGTELTDVIGRVQEFLIEYGFAPDLEIARNQRIALSILIHEENGQPVPNSYAWLFKQTDNPSR